MSAEYHKYVVALREFGKVGPKGFQQLLLRFGSPENIYKASVKELEELPRISESRAQEILNSKFKLEEIEKRLEDLEEIGIRVSTILDDNFPEILKSIDDPPPLLYYKGNFPLTDKNSVALVGTTQASEEGIENAVSLGKALAHRNVVVVSGLAKGIDAAGHIGALKENGISLAILGSGLLHIYPSENLSLAEEICKAGALLSEYNPDTPVNVGQLMARNRIIVGLSRAVIVVETDQDTTGSLNAAQKAVDQSRPLFVVVKKETETVKELEKLGAIPIEGEKDISLVLDYLC